LIILRKNMESQNQKILFGQKIYIRMIV